VTRSMTMFNLLLLRRTCWSARAAGTTPHGTTVPTDAEFFSLLNAGLTDSSDRELLELVPVTTDTSIRELSVQASTPAASIQPEMQMPKSLPAAVDEQRINKDTSQLARDRQVVQETSTEMHMPQSLPAAVNKQHINNDTPKLVRNREMVREASTRRQSSEPSPGV